MEVPIGAVKGVGTLGLERYFARSHDFFDHPHVEKKGVRALPRENLDAGIHAAALFVNAKCNGTPARRNASALLERPPRIGPTARDVERAVKCELGSTRCKGRFGTHRSNLNRPYPKPIDDCVGEDS